MAISSNQKAPQKADSHLTRRGFLGAAAALAAAAQSPAQDSLQTPAPTSTPSAPPILDLADWSYSFIGVEHATLARGTICNGMQMFVERFIPNLSIVSANEIAPFAKVKSIATVEA